MILDSHHYNGTGFAKKLRKPYEIISFLIGKAIWAREEAAEELEKSITEAMKIRRKIATAMSDPLSIFGSWIADKSGY